MPAEEHRRDFSAALAAVPGELADLARIASAAMRSATAAVLTNPARARRVHQLAVRARERGRTFDEQVVGMLARQAPVAGDLRLLVAGLRIASALERMAELAEHIAEAAERRAGAVVPARWQPEISRIGALCEQMATGLAEAVAALDPAAEKQLHAAEDQIDALHRRMLAAVTAESWPHGVQAGIDVALLSRFFERFADQAVTAARQLAGVRPADEGEQPHPTA
jgi:phosphate transport system protein